MGGGDCMHRIYYPGRRTLLLTKHGEFNEDKFRLLSWQSGSVYIDKEHTDRQRENESIRSPRPVQWIAQNQFQGSILRQLPEEPGFQGKDDTNKGNNMISKSPENDVLLSEQEVSAEQGRRYPTREWETTIGFTISPIDRLHDSDEPLIKDALEESKSAQRNAAVKKGISALENMQCWTLASRLTDRKILHSKFLLLRKRNEWGKVVKYKSRLVVCVNEELHFHDESFFPVADYTVAKIVTCMCLMQGCETIHLDFDNAFCNRWLDLPVSSL